MLSASLISFSFCMYLFALDYFVFVFVFVLICTLSVISSPGHARQWPTAWVLSCKIYYVIWFFLRLFPYILCWYVCRYCYKMWLESIPWKRICWNASRKALIILFQEEVISRQIQIHVKWWYAGIRSTAVRATRIYQHAISLKEFISTEETYLVLSGLLYKTWISLIAADWEKNPPETFFWEFCEWSSLLARELLQVVQSIIRCSF